MERAREWLGLEAVRVQRPQYLSPLEFEELVERMPRVYSVEEAMRVPSFYQAIMILSYGTAMVPLQVTERQPNGGKKTLVDHPVSVLLNGEADEAALAMDVRAMLQRDAITRGNGISEIGRSRFRPTGLNWIDPSYHNEPKLKDDGRVIYPITGDAPLRAPDVLHIKSLSLRTPRWGRGIISHAGDSLGLALALDRAAQMYYANGAQWPAVVNVDLNVKREDRADVRKEIKRELRGSYGGEYNVGAAAVFFADTKVQQWGSDPEKAQMLQSRAYSVRETSRWTQVPAFMLGETEGANFNSLEALTKHFLRSALSPWFGKWECECTAKLLTPGERRAGLRVEYDRRAIEAADLATQVTRRVRQVVTGIMTANEARAEDGMEPKPGGDVLRFPANQAPAQEGHPKDQRRRRGDRVIILRRTSGDESFRARMSLRDGIEGPLARELARLVTAEVGKLRSGLADVSNFQGLLDLIARCHEGFPDRLRRILAPLLLDYMRSVGKVATDEVGGDRGVFEARLEGFNDAYVETFADRWMGSTRAQLEEVGGQEITFDPAPVEQRLTEWEATRAAKWAASEATRASGAASRLAYAVAGVTALKWLANPDACPLCRSVHGTIVSVTAAFLSDGDVVAGGDDVSDLKVTKTIRHPPLHGLCKCNLGPA